MLAGFIKLIDRTNYDELTLRVISRLLDGWLVHPIKYALLRCCCQQRLNSFAQKGFVCFCALASFAGKRKGQDGSKKKRLRSWVVTMRAHGKAWVKKKKKKKKGRRTYKLLLVYTFSSRGRRPRSLPSLVFFFLFFLGVGLSVWFPPRSESHSREILSNPRRDMDAAWKKIGKRIRRDRGGMTTSLVCMYMYCTHVCFRALDLVDHN